MKIIKSFKSKNLTPLFVWEILALCIWNHLREPERWNDISYTTKDYYHGRCIDGSGTAGGYLWQDPNYTRERYKREFYYVEITVVNKLNKTEKFMGKVSLHADGLLFSRNSNNKPSIMAKHPIQIVEAMLKYGHLSIKD